MAKFGFKDFFKERIPVEVLSGGHILTDNPAAPAVNKAAIMKGDEPGQVYANTMYGQKPFTFNRIEWDESHARSGGKAAVGAIAGTMVAGPLGGIAGAAIGGKRKDTSKAFLYLQEQEGVEHKVHINCDEKLYKKLSTFLG